MSQSAGTISAELRIAIDKLQGDIGKVQAEFAKIPPTVDQQNQKTQTSMGKLNQNVTKNLTEMSNTGINKMTTMAQGMHKALMAVPIVGAIMLIVGALQKVGRYAVQWINDTSQAYLEHQQQLMKINHTLQQTGAIAWTTARDMEQMAFELAGSTGRTTNEVLQMQAVLLQFGTIVGENFERASEVIVDMAALMGKDLASAAQTFGRVLEEPIRGMMYLRRQGIFLTEAERERIQTLEESGRRQEAQNEILRVAQGIYGGLAQAINDVNYEQSRFETARERRILEQGQQTSGLIHIFYRVRADIEETTLAQLQLNNAIRRAERADYSQHLDQLYRLENQAERAREEIQRLQGIRLTLDDAEFYEQLRDAQRALERATQQRVRVELELGYERVTNGLILVQREIRRIEDQMNTIGSEYNQILRTRLELYRTQETSLISQQQRQRELMDVTGQAAADRIHYLSIEEAQLSQLRELVDRATEAEEQRYRVIQNINRARQRGLVDEERARQMTQAAYMAEANAVNDLISQTEALETTSLAASQAKTRAMGQFNSSLDTAIAYYHRFAAAVEEGFTEAHLQEFYKNQRETLANIRRHLDSEMAAGRVSREHHNETMLAAEQRFVRAFEALAKEQGLVWEEHPVVLESISREWASVSHQLQQIEQENRKAAATEWIERYEHRVALLDAQEEERALRQRARTTRNHRQRQEYEAQYRAAQERRVALEREWALTQLKASDVFKYASAEQQAVMIRLTESMHRVSEATEEIADNSQMWLQTLVLTQQAIFAIGQLTTAIIQNITREQLHHLSIRHREEMRLINENLEARNEAYRQDFENLMYWNGLARAATEEHHENEILMAMQTGNHREMLRAEQAQKEFRIRQEYERRVAQAEKEAQQKREAAEQEYRQRRAEIEHRGAMAQWKIQLALTTASVAQAIMKSWGQLGIFGAPAAALMAGIGAIQMAAVVAAKPRMQRFNTGGIVSGDPYRGDSTPILAKGREMVLTEEQQKNLFDMIKGGEKPEPTYITAVIEMDGEKVAEKCFEIGSLGNSFIKARGVV